MFNDRLQGELDKYYAYDGDRFVRYTHRLRINQIRNSIAEVRNRHQQSTTTLKALDAGCCHGVYSIMLAEAGYEVFAIDIDHEGIRKARQWAGERGIQNKITFDVGDIQNIKQDDSAFDVVICSEVLEHLDVPGHGARELYRVLKPNGKAIVSMPNMACLFGLLQWSYRKSGIRSLLGKPPLDTFQIQHSLYWFGNIQRLLKDSGFILDDKYSTSHLPYFWELDALLEKAAPVSSLLQGVEEWMAKWPIVKYFGYNFIVVAHKPGVIR